MSTSILTETTHTIARDGKAVAILTAAAGVSALQLTVLAKDIDEALKPRIEPQDYMAAWEAFLDYKAAAEAPGASPRCKAFAGRFDEGGWRDMRDEAAKFTVAANAFYHSLTERQMENLDSYDWDFLPGYLSLIDWESDVETYPTRAEAFQALIKK